jgi:hypothetical protein
MPDCPVLDQSGTVIKKKLTMPGQVRYRTKPRQSGIFLVRYRTEIIDAGMPMPSGVSFLDADAWSYCSSRTICMGMDTDMNKVTGQEARDTGNRYRNGRSVATFLKCRNAGPSGIWSVR